MTTWLITGCSSGLGRNLAEAVLKRGWNAVVTARNPAKVEDIVARYPDTVLALALDVTDHKQVNDTGRQAEARFGAVDVLVNNAGHGYRAAVEEGEEAEVAALFAANFFGPVALIKAALPGMRARRRGTIVNLSSIAARNPGPGSGYYAATKCALEALSGSLRKEVGPLGVKVIAAEPGEFRTDFSGRSLLQSRTAISDYAETSGRRQIENDKTDGHQRGDPARGAQAIVDAVEAADPPHLLLLGSDAIQVVGAALDADRAMLEAWKATSLTTDFPA
ncbi:short-chain dehydrogenase/reductase [Rhodoblastus sphagnicola]|uniref:Short-chain dehydrogenase/reductase n=1 Tax=Rhodoblastus sphagnicola TaxID=333368 RepID=A0A2S6N0L7_9HYPH|nr:oxidoreductase [Rhodoblastus sphagnicola]MBB4200476.1 NAD(P)-dependent dehydrogenase (short-subunit alcohol dehydrogenase family) [Rhodoblastus sphagnicola]PPQ28173.1 short-chain dehydrogenase/reductase [Rhodoblastus sphagnicola]